MNESVMIGSNQYNGVEIHKAPKNEYVFKAITPDGRLNWIQRLKFQDGFQGTEGVNGVHNEELLVVLIDRLDGLNKVLPCEANETVLKNLKESLTLLQQRSKDREDRGVLGTEKT